MGNKKNFFCLLVGYHMKSFWCYSHMMLISFLNITLWSFLDIVWFGCFVWEMMRFFTPLVSAFKIIFHVMFIHMNLMFYFIWKFEPNLHVKDFALYVFDITSLSPIGYPFFVFHMKMIWYFIWHMIHMKSYMHASPIDKSSYCHFSFEISCFS